jgi:hypothetical protein
MNVKKNFGICLFEKETTEQNALRSLMQLVRTQNVGRALNFSFVEAQSSLLPDLSLWENVQLELGGLDWRDLQEGVSANWQHLMNLITDPHLKASEAQHWERFAISLLKGTAGKNSHLLIDVNEKLLSPLVLKHFRNIIMDSATQKNVLVASAHTSVWLDCAHAIVKRKSYEFETEILDLENIKKHWAA